MGKVLGLVASAALAPFTGGLSFSLSGFLLSVASSLVMSAVSRALAPRHKKPSSFSSDFSAQSSGLTQTVREPLGSHKVIYGQTRVGGNLVYVTSSNENKYLHYVMVVASHEVESIDEVWINDVCIPPDAINGSNIVTSGRFANKVRIKKYLGTSGQSADSDLISESGGEWTTNHKLSGRAYLYIRFEYDSDKYPGGLPQVSCFVKGKKIYDNRTTSTRWTPNMALVQYDYFTNDIYGVAADGDIDLDTMDASANISEEIVDVSNVNFSVTSVASSTDIITLSGDMLSLILGDRVTIASSGSVPGGLSAATDYYVIPYQFKDTPRIKLALSLDDAIDGTEIDITSAGTGTITITKTGEPRYFGGGVIDTDKTLESNIQDLLSATGGRAIYAGGKWRIKVAAYEAPTITISENDFVEPVIINTRLSRRERFNEIKGVYRSPFNFDVSSDYPFVRSSTYITDDNGETITSDYDQPFTQRPQNAKRIAKIELLRSRQEIVVKGTCNLNAMRLQCGDTVNLTLAKFGFSSKIFEVTNWSLASRDGNDAEGPSYVVELVLRETASAVFDWSTSEESAIDPAPNTTLPDAFDVGVVTGFSLDSYPVNTKELDRIYNVIATWDAHDNQFVVSGGKYEIQYRETTDTEYKSAGTVAGDTLEFILPTLKPDVLYDIRIFAYNGFGVRSAATVINNFQAGQTVTTNTEDWENESLARDTDDWETDTLTSEDWEA